MHLPWNLWPTCQRPPDPCLVFAPLAWLKLVYLCHSGETEIGGFGISAPDALLYVQEFVTLKQQVTPSAVRFLDEAVADHFDACYERGIPPAHCGRLWIHTHPGDSAAPSSTDEETFARSFGSCDWAVMMILARSGQTYARLAFNVGPKTEIDIPVRVDWSAWPDCVWQQPSLDARVVQWREEYDANVQRHCFPAIADGLPLQPVSLGDQPWWEEDAWGIADGSFHLNDLEELHHAYLERRRAG